MTVAVSPSASASVPAAPRYPAYRPSGIEWLGEIPEHWEVKRLKYSVETNPTKIASVALSEDFPVSFLPMEKVGERGELDLSVTKSFGDVRNGYTCFQDGDVILAKITPCFENGKGAVCVGLTNGIGFGSTEFIVVRPSEELDRRFLYFWFASPTFRTVGEAQMKGSAGQKRVPEDFISNFPMPMPPLPEQRAIAAYLDRETGRIDALTAKKERLIALLEEKRAALISRAVTRGLRPDAPMRPSGIEWLGEIPEHWEIKKMSYCFRTIGSGTTPETSTAEHFGGDIPWVTTSELRERLIADTQKKLTVEAFEKYSALKMFPPGSLLIAMYGATIGRLGILGISACVNQACCALANPVDCAVSFTWYYLMAYRNQLIEMASGGGQPNISQEKIRQFRICLPPLSEQAEIVEYLDRQTIKIDSLIAKIKQHIALLKERRAALIAAVVTGKRDVRDRGAGADAAFSPGAAAEEEER